MMTLKNGVMKMWGRKIENTTIPSHWGQKFEILIAEVQQVAAKQKTLEAQFELLQTDMANLRGIINRKLRGKDIEIEKDSSESVKYNDGFDPLRGL